MLDSCEKLRTWAEIDLDAAEKNFESVRRALPPEMKIATVVKANAYGHGAVRFAKLLENKTDYFAVAMTEEAMELRNNGIKTPILILGHVSEFDFAELVSNSVTCTVCDFDEANAISREAIRQNKCADIHIAVDTGMSRIGFDITDESVEEIKKINRLEGVKIEGVFSHFAASDTRDREYARLQLRRFTQFCEKLEKNGIEIKLKHLYNSAAIADFTPQFDMVRQGIILYGLKPSDEVEYKNMKPTVPVMSLKTRVTQIRELPSGVPVSYGCTYVTDKNTRVATLCAGYADGVPRLISNKGSVLIKGKKAPIIGRVCMDQFMVDITDIPDVKTGDVATVFGSDGELTITADEVAQQAQTIGYEIICNINRRVPRIYIKNGKFENIK